VLIRADLLFIAGALAMALAPNSGVLILGRALVGLGVVGLYKLNPVDPSRLKAPGFNP
jgi:MFS family permease